VIVRSENEFALTGGLFLVDHIGNMETFPSIVNLIVGPGFKKSFLPGFPIDKDGLLLATDWEGRNLIELEFKTDLKLGRFKATDYFEDGSFYLLDAPGHAVGHLCGLARVSNDSKGHEDSFVLMGGDACHHGRAPNPPKAVRPPAANDRVPGGQLKPSQYLPLPKDVSLSRPIKGESICPGSLFRSVHRDNSDNAEFYKMAANFPHVYDQAEQTIHDMQEFDAAQNVLVIIAHDPAPLQERSGFKFFPNGNLNEWKKDRLDERIRWSFLEDFSHAVELGAQQDTKIDSGLTLKA
jgi:glyoxylase-like metal-dependent hydrolase (beta-lactamase superfamily II)